ncbi:hypothetical protein BH09SUM1_BH09SUM1_30140 [soil metagenome]
MNSLLLWFVTGHVFLRSNCRRAPSLGAAFACGAAMYIISGFATAAADAPWQHMEAFPLLIAALAAIYARKPLRFSFRFPALSESPARRAVFYFLCALHVIALYRIVAYMGVPLANYDVLSYHGPLAQAFAHGEGGAVFLAPQTFYARMPLGAAILEGAMLRANSAGAGGIEIQLLMAATLLAGASCAARIVALLGGRREARLLASLLYLMHAGLTTAMLQGLSDPLVALFAIAAWELLLAGRKFAESKWTWFFAGLCGAAAFTIKFSAIGVACIPLGIGAIILAATFRHRSVGTRLAWFIAFGIGAAFSTAPWLVRAQLIGGNAAFPFRGETGDWSHAQAEFVVNAHHPISPISLGYWSDAAAKLNNFGYAIGPWNWGSLMLITALLWCAFRRRRAECLLLAAALIGYLFWISVQLNPARFLLPAAVLLIPIAALFTGRILAGSRLGLIIGLLMTSEFFAPALSGLSNDVTFDKQYTVSARQKARASYLGAPLIGIVDAADAQPFNGKLLLVFEAQDALFHRPVESRPVWDKPSWSADLKASTSAADFESRLHARGIGAVFVNEFEWGRLLDFYAAEKFTLEGKLWRRIGIHSNASESLIMKALREYPPHRFAGFTDRDLTILRDFLLSCRSRAFAATPPGGGAEIWCAEILDEKTQ